MNTNLLKSQIILKGHTLSQVSHYLNVSKSSLYRKMYGENEFTRKEMLKIKVLLDLSNDVMMEIFFNEKVS